MIRFNCDYAEGAHIRILQRLMETNDEQTDTYGRDYHSENAYRYIRQLCECEDAYVQFISGGTQTNLTIISTILRPYQGVISAHTGHIASHETGAIEATGHRILTIPSADGKIYAHEIRALIEAHYSDRSRETTVQPGMVYISQSSENGTTYTLSELEAISACCREYEIPLFIDGARLGYAMAAKSCDYTLADLARLCDVFYIGGTKIGAMFGEAVVIINPEYQRNFRYNLKQRGAMLAKGRMMGIQFEVLFEDGLYFEISKHAVKMADKLRDGLTSLGFSFMYDTDANQVFPILSSEQVAKLEADYDFFVWEKIGEDKSVIRLCTSWCTPEENVDAFLTDISKI